MLLARKQVKDSKTGRLHNMVVCRVATDQGMSEVTLPEARYNTLDGFVRAHGYWFSQIQRVAGDSTDPLAFYVSQLAYTEAQMFARQRQPVLYKDLVPVSYEAPPWAETVEYQTFDQVGKGKRIAANGTDIPLVDVKFGRKIVEVAQGGLGYHYNLQELVASQQLKRPLSDLRMQVAVQGCDRHLNEVALNGEENFGGLWNHSSVTPVQAPTGAWDTAGTDPLAILADLNKAIAAVYNGTGTNDVVTHIGMPIDALNALASRVLTGTAGANTIVTGMSLLNYLKENNLSKLLRKVDIEFFAIPGLETAGTLSHTGTSKPGTSRVIYYVKSPDRLVMHVPQTLTFLAPQLERLSVVVPASYRYAGLEIRYPKSVYYQDAVLAADLL